MLTLRVLLAAAVLTIAAPTLADDAGDIRELEQAWGRAFLAGDYPAIEAMVAPEFQLMRAEAGETDITPRAQWFTNARRLTFHDYEVEVVDVLVVDQTAVATVRGRWRISRGGPETRNERFVVTDTWVRREGRWQVVFRHSSPGEAVSGALEPTR